jgi:hypothetical protein
MTERFDGILLSIASQLQGGGIDQVSISLEPAETLL